MKDNSLLEIINPALVTYVEKNIYPIYKKNDEGHQLPHIRYVINRSIKFAEQFEGINYDICYAAAAFHDVGHHIDRKNHEKESARIFMADGNMAKFFSEQERIIIKEAIEDHRASLHTDPRSVYGKILTSADRTINLNECMSRADAYTKEHFPDFTLLQRIQRAYEHISKKYGPGVYVKTYVEDKELQVFLKEVESMLKNKPAFVNRFFDACGLYPEVGVDRDFVIKLIGQKQFRRLEELHRKKYEAKFYNDSVEKERPFVIEFTGTPRTGKTTIINSLSDFFGKAGFKVCVIEEFTSSDYFKTTLRKKWKDLGYTVAEVNANIFWIVLDQLKKAIECGEYDIIILDRGLSDRHIWHNIRLQKRDFTQEEYDHYCQVYSENASKLIDMIVITSVAPDECVKRDFSTCISLEKRHFITAKNIKTFNNVIKEIRPFFEKTVERVVSVNTDSRPIDSILISVAGEIVSAIKDKYAKNLEL